MIVYIHIYIKDTFDDTIIKTPGPTVTFETTRETTKSQSSKPVATKETTKSQSSVPVITDHTTVIVSEPLSSNYYKSYKCLMLVFISDEN